MSKTVRIFLIFLAFDALVAGVYFGVKALGSGRAAAAAAEVPWVSMNESYQPKTELEEVIKTDYAGMELLPLQFRDFGHNPAVLKRFRGSKLVGPAPSVLEMQFRGLEDWALVEIWFKGEEGREIRRTILYVLTDNTWKAGDNGRLAD
jgi:hypothetical protein